MPLKTDEKQGRNVSSSVWKHTHTKKWLCHRQYVLSWKNCLNAAETVHVYRRNHRQIHGLCILKALPGLAKRFDKNDCTCYRARSRWSRCYGSASASNFRTPANSKICWSGIEYAKNNTHKSTAHCNPHASIPAPACPMDSGGGGSTKFCTSLSKEVVIWYDGDNDFPLFFLNTNEAKSAPKITYTGQTQKSMLCHEYLYTPLNLLCGAALWTHLFSAFTYMKKRHQIL